MLRISRRVDYAVRTMLAAAASPSDTYISTPDIGEMMLIPQPFLVKVIGDLKRGGLLKTAVGRNGGVMLAQPADAITLRHIVEAVEGPIAITECLLTPEPCEKGIICPAHDVWVEIQQTLHHQLEAVNLATLVTYHRQALKNEMGE